MADDGIPQNQVLRCNPFNVEYLLGVSRISGLGNGPRVLDFALSEYAKPDQTGLSPQSRSLSIELCAWPNPHLPNQYIAGHKFVRLTRNGSDDGVPRIEFVKLGASGNIQFNCVIFLRSLLSDIPRLDGTYTVYCHIVGRDGDPARRYVGITRRGWAVRWREHENAARGGSPYLFHRAIREAGVDRIPYQFHSIVGIGCSFEEAMALEESHIAKFSLYPRGLNMIPGGFEGIRYLGRHGFKNVSPRKWEHRATLIREFSESCRREGKPNPLLAAIWRDDDFAASVICKNPNNFSKSEVDEIRYLSSLGYDTAGIASRFGVAERRVTQLLCGDTYSRVH